VDGAEGKLLPTIAVEAVEVPKAPERAVEVVNTQGEPLPPARAVEAGVVVERLVVVDVAAELVLGAVAADVGAPAFEEERAGAPAGNHVDEECADVGLPHVGVDGGAERVVGVPGPEL